jgi:hypothetical protein
VSAGKSKNQNSEQLEERGQIIKRGIESRLASCSPFFPKMNLTTMNLSSSLIVSFESLHPVVVHLLPFHLGRLICEVFNQPIFFYFKGIRQRFGGGFLIPAGFLLFLLFLHYAQFTILIFLFKDSGQQQIFGGRFLIPARFLLFLLCA